MDEMDHELIQELKDKFDFSLNEGARWFVRSMTHRSYANERDLDYDNERLEFLGDAVIDLIVCEKLFRDYADSREGRLSEIKSAVVNTESLTEIARKLQLADHLRLSKGEEQVQRGRDKVIADTLEAFVGAVFVSAGFNETKEFILPFFEEKIEEFIAEGTRNYKGKLLEWPQERGYAQPDYRVENVEGPQHKPRHTVSVSIDGTTYGTGSGRTKKDAEQEAARTALDQLSANPS